MDEKPQEPFTARTIHSKVVQMQFRTQFARMQKAHSQASPPAAPRLAFGPRHAQGLSAAGGTPSIVGRLRSGRLRAARLRAARLGGGRGGGARGLQLLYQVLQLAPEGLLDIFQVGARLLELLIAAGRAMIGVRSAWVGFWARAAAGEARTQGSRPHSKEDRSARQHRPQARDSP